jgi:8-oxo-dGTP pyrophosphatase MutT (NUDIX family)
VPTPRRAARAVLLDPQDRLLLLKVVNPRRGGVYWVTPGGGLNDGESGPDALRRELAEELGLEGAVVGPPLWRNHRYFRLGDEVFSQDEVFHVTRTSPFRVDMSRLDETERLTHVGYRWWTLGELETTTEKLYPHDLARLLRRLLDEGPPSTLVDLAQP